MPQKPSSRYRPAPSGHIHIRIPDAESDLQYLIRDAAEQEDVPVSEWVRKTLRQQAKRQRVREELKRRAVEEGEYEPR